MNIVYSGKMVIGGSGIGTTAYHQARPLMDEGLLKQVYSLGATDEDIAKITNKIDVPNAPSIVQDILFDGIVSLVFDEENVDILQTWGAHCLYTFQSLKSNITKIVNLYSAHIQEQAKILNGELGIQDMVNPLHIKKLSRELEIADYIFIPSDWVYRSLQKHGLENKAKVIPFGVNLERFIPPDQPREVDSNFRAIFVGRNWVRKGLIYLLEAWKKMPSNAELVIVGLDKTSAKGFPDVKNIMFYDWIEDLIAEYQKSDVFVLPALEDGCPLVTYEAMACGLPAIVSENTGTAQHIWNGQNGFIVPIRDVDNLTDRLIYLYKNRDHCIEMGKSARKMAESFPWERHEKEYVKWIKSL